MKTFQSTLSVMGVVALVGLFAFTHTAAAQVSQGLTISPGVIELAEAVEPGSTYHFTMRVTNNSDTARTLYLAAQDIEGVNAQNQPVFAPDGETVSHGLSTWLNLPSEAMEFAPGERKEVSFSATVPENASPGGHFGAVFLDAQPPRLRTIGAGIAMRVGSVMNLRVAGEAHEEATLREFSTDRLVYDSPVVSFTMRVDNPGNILLRPQGFIEITDMSGRQVTRLPVNENLTSVFPGDERTLSEVWEHDGFAIGRYQATLALVYGGDARRSLRGTTSFWVLPFKPIAVTLGVLLTLLLGFYIMVKMHIRKKLREMGASSRGRANANLYARKYQGPVSRLTITAVSITLFTMVFMVGLFFLFA